MSASDLQQASRLYNRSVDLIELAKRYFSDLPGEHGDVIDYYNALRADVKQLVNDPDFERSVPPAWNYSFLGIRIYMTKVKEIQNLTKLLHRYLRDYILFKYPHMASQLAPNYRARLDLDLERQKAINRELQEELAGVKGQLSQYRDMWAALKTPSHFEISQDILDKLNSLEQTRLLEAVQAYRVNAWTPAVAVCGMILEGRLQILCQRYGMRSGGIGEMIRRLGDTGLLRGHHQHLARVGEFFRHRAVHPTSEEFDREKTTLVLTSLVILVRDLF